MHSAIRALRMRLIRLSSWECFYLESLWLREAFFLKQQRRNVCCPHPYSTRTSLAIREAHFSGIPYEIPVWRLECRRQPKTAASQAPIIIVISDVRRPCEKAHTMVCPATAPITAPRSIRSPNRVLYVSFMAVVRQENAAPASSP